MYIIYHINYGLRLLTCGVANHRLERVYKEARRAPRATRGNTLPLLLLQPPRLLFLLPPRRRRRLLLQPSRRLLLLRLPALQLLTLRKQRCRDVSAISALLRRY